MSSSPVREEREALIAAASASRRRDRGLNGDEEGSSSDLPRHYHSTPSPSRRKRSRRVGGDAVVGERMLCLVITGLLTLLAVGALTYSLRYNPHPDTPTTNLPPGSGSSDPHVVVPISIPSIPPPTDLPRNPAYLIKAQNGAVASEDITCSQMGVAVLEEGGNAVDAAVTTCLCIGVLNSFSSGIGGGGFMLVRVPPSSAYLTTANSFSDSGSESLAWSDKFTHPAPLRPDHPSNRSIVKAFDFRETSPKDSQEEMYLQIPGSSQVGGLAVGVPGELKGLRAAFDLYGSGRLTWERLVQPNVDLAKGFRASRELARRFRIFGTFMKGLPEWEAVYRPRGAMLVEGDWVRRANYSVTLQDIARNGVDGFYGLAPEADSSLLGSTGQEPVKDSKAKSPNWIAESMIAKIQATGGVMTIDDLREYEVRIYDAISSTYADNTVYTTDAPSCGPVMLGMLNALETYDLSIPGGSEGNPGLANKTRTGLNVHRITEALKFAFGGRNLISDPAENLMGGERREAIEGFSRKAWGKAVAENITDDRTHTASYYSQYDTLADSGTTHMSVADRWGGAVSLTSTVNLIFGSRVMDDTTGIILNDEQDDFSTPGKLNAFGLPPSPYNFPEPNKRPLSSTAATIVERPDGELYVALGGSGGSRIFGAVAQVLLNLEWGMDISEAIEAPRLHDQLGGIVTVETGFEFTKDLKNRQHNVTAFDINLGVAEVQAVLRHTNGTLFAASDSRKNGWAWGF